MLDLDNSDFTVAASEVAVQRIADALCHPDDLTNKLDVLIKRNASERARVEAQLKSVISGQLDGASRGLHDLDTSVTRTRHICTHLQAIASLCSDAQNEIRNYGRIKKISRTHQNFLATKEMVEQFRQLDEQVHRIGTLLEADMAHRDGMAPNLLFVHYQLQRLEAFRNRVLTKAWRSVNADVWATLGRYFHKLDLLQTRFETYLFELAARTVSLLQQGLASVVVRVVHIIEVEERLDEAAAQQPTDDGLLDDATSAIAARLRPRQVKGYRIRYFDGIHETIVSHVETIFAEHLGDLEGLLAEVDGMVENLVTIHDDLIPRFPKRYNIFHYFVLEYHRQIHGILNRLVNDTLETGSILKLLKWVTAYYDNMQNRIGVGEELLEPPLLDGKEADLIRQYLDLLQIKLREWFTNILTSETQLYLTRAEPPETDGSQIYYVGGSVMVFQMINQQVDVVLSASARMVPDIISECSGIFTTFATHWLGNLHAELQRFLDPRDDRKDRHAAEPLAPGLPEYVMAVGNDFLRSAEFTEVLSARTTALLQEPHRSQTASLLQEVREGFMKVTRRATTSLVDIVLADLQPAMVQLHTPSWYDHPLMAMIVSTLDDYCGDFQAHLSEYLFSKLMTELLERMVIKYLESFRNKGAKYRANAGDKIRHDIAAMTQFFAQSKAEKRVVAAVEPLTKIVSIIESSMRMVFLDFWALYQAYRDMPIAYIEDLLSRREDLTKSNVREIMENIHQKTEEDRENYRPGPQGIAPTVFSKITMGPSK
ncbi:hypothetical protein CXG81DRAFT_13545 [Caulochytrium protostelioides]|uniref:Uncharacterized protein n=1 Tax=Caulochytrium protostelioides TaxID=1555241 RepID=A0A4P9X4Z3_9FUNG|nr:hypothetical protein CXG81DRAFT_13545 [Caulochytrium protostelioides]|eukprot:RKP00177.1 hypothetical protein CXG81DRAFT_13545 [Caulochytrium protostelioides]